VKIHHVYPSHAEMIVFVFLNVLESQEKMLLLGVTAVTKGRKK